MPVASLGVEFSIDGQGHFGWIRLRVSPDPSSEFGHVLMGTISGYAYNTVADQPIVAGQVPEPGTLGLLALGSLGIAAWRRRRERVVNSE